MKFLHLIWVLLLLSSCSKNEEDRPIEINWRTTQEELNSFRKELENMEVFEGNIHIGRYINDISALNQLTVVTGELTFGSIELESIRLPNLERVGALDISGNSALKIIDIPQIKTVDDAITILNNSALDTIQMNNLQRIEEYGINIIFNDSLQSIELQRLEWYSGLNFRWNPVLNQVNLQPSIPEKCEVIRLYFDYIKTGSALFQNSSNLCFLDIEISNSDDSYLKWLLNLDGNNILNHTHIVGDFEIDQFCFLQEKVSQMDYPLNFKVGSTFYSSDFTGYEIIQECN